MKPTIISTEKLYRGRVLELEKSRIEESGLEYEREIVVHAGSAVIIPLHENGEITFVRQYRHAAGTYLLELPAGTVEKDESPADCAHRELAEETGHKAGELVKLSEFYVSPGFLTEKMHLFKASKLTPTPVKPDIDERIDLVRLSLARALEMIEKDEISDAKTIIGILLVARSRKPIN